MRGLNVSVLMLPVVETTPTPGGTALLVGPSQVIVGFSVDPVTLVEHCRL